MEMENIVSQPLPTPSLLNKEFEACLPPGWGTNITTKKIVEGEDKFPNVQLKFFIKCANKEEFGRWLIEFENLTNASYTINCTDNEDGPRIKFKQRLRCHHSTNCRKTYDPSIKNKTRNTNCPSKMTVTIHVLKKKYRGINQEKFQTLQQTPCEITLVLTHNHTTGTADSLRFRKVSGAIREELLSLYRNGHTAGTALEMIKFNIQLTMDDYVTCLADRNKCPSYKYCYDLYKKEFKKNYSPMKFDTEAKIFLENKLKLYNDTQKSECAKMVLMGEENVDYVIGICTPIMKRGHKHIEGASEIVFMDSSGTGDKDVRIYLLLTHSECGSLPLGLIITNSECVDAIKCGFQILKELLGESMFGGHKEGPKVFITDDSSSEQQAIGDTWPQSKRMLCIFHVLQAVSRWLTNSKNGIPKDQQTEIFNDFRNILYANNLEEIRANYNLALEKANSFPNYVNYLSNYWWPKRQSWIKAYRNSELMKNNHTNNSESTIRQIKDQIFSRVKAFNVVQMVDFMLTKFEDYTKRQLLDATSDRSRGNPLHKEIIMPPTELFKRIKQLSDNIVSVPSETQENVEYLVNMEVLTCLCTGGITGAICKHIHWANMLFCTEKYVMTIDNLKNENLYFVATGQLAKRDRSLINNTKSIEVKDQNGQSFSEKICVPTDSDNNDIQLTSLNINGDGDEIKNKFYELFAEMTKVFYKHFEKSPVEMATGMKIMMSRIKKIKTPAEFASAMATFGLAADHRGKNISIQKSTAGRRIKKQQNRLHK